MVPVRKMAVTFALLAAAAMPAQAQFGSIMGHIKDKAAEKANKKIDEKVDGKKNDAQQQGGSGPGSYQTTGACAPPTFGPGNIELNSDGVSKVLKAFQALHDAGEKNGRNALAARLESDKARLQELEEDPAISDAQESESQYKTCQNEAFQKIIQKNVEAKGGMWGSPEYMKAMREHQEKIAAAEQRGDSAKAKALQDSTLYVWQKVWAPTAADSAEVLKKCGKPPRASRKLAERDSLRVTVREEADSIRGLDEDAEDAVRAASGLTGRQFATARERLQMYLAMGTPCGFTKAEVDAIESKKGELQKLINGK